MERDMKTTYGYKGGNGAGLFLEEYYWGSDPC